MTLGIVLSGGGARGAYEVGVLSYVLRELVLRRRQAPQLDIVSGTSVGDVNGSFIASSAHDFPTGLDRLEQLWKKLDLSQVLGFSLKQAANLPRVLTGGLNGAGICDAAPLATLVGQGIDWRSLSRNIRQGRIKALSVSATNVPTGKPIVFIDRTEGVELPTRLPKNILVRGERIGPTHVLASASIPIIFPPIRIGKQLHCDGGLRLNTPMAPAIHLGADRLFVIGVSRLQPHAALPDDVFPGASFLLGKVLNAFLLDHLNADIVELERTNALLRTACEVGGADFLEKVNIRAKEKGESPRRIVEAFAIHPSEDLGEIAANVLRRKKRSALQFMRSTSLLRFLDVGEGGEADLASYLLFDREYASELISLGQRDARARSAEIEEFLFRT